MKKYVFFVIAALISSAVYAKCPQYAPYNCKVIGYKSNGEPMWLWSIM